MEWWGISRRKGITGLTMYAARLMTVKSASMSAFLISSTCSSSGRLIWLICIVTGTPIMPKHVLLRPGAALTGRKAKMRVPLRLRMRCLRTDIDRPDTRGTFHRLSRVNVWNVGPVLAPAWLFSRSRRNATVSIMPLRWRTASSSFSIAKSMPGNRGDTSLMSVVENAVCGTMQVTTA